MKFFVTGLCMSRNLGGPAMALTLVNELKKKYADAEFVFAVSPSHLDVEREWGNRFGLKVVPTYHPLRKPLQQLKIDKILLLLGIIRKVNKKKELDWNYIEEQYFKELSSSDIVIDMSGIAYIGDSAYKLLNGFRSYANYHYARSLNKPYQRFILTFGPFNHWEVRFFAKREFKYLSFIAARGKQSAAMCKEITDNPNKVYDFPDIAVKLEPASEGWLQQYLSSKSITPKQYVIFSPSAVVYNLPKSAGGSVGEEYLRALAEVIKRYALAFPNEKIMLLPHMYSEIAHESDRDKCYKLLEFLKEDPCINRTILVDEDIDPREAKAIISQAKFAVVSRYHALVASLSTAVPAIAIGWNVKYQDLLDYYNMDAYSVDCRNYNGEELANRVYNLVMELSSNVDVEQLKALQVENSSKVDSAFVMLFDWIKAQR